jgi:hypothetical protein
MKKIILYSVILFLAASCSKHYPLERRDEVYLKKRNFIAADPAICAKPSFVALPAGTVRPEGWLRDWAEAAAAGITGHLDERDPVFGMAWKGVGFSAIGTNPTTGTGWCLEQSSYWLDGAIRLAYILNDSALINKVSSRLNTVIDGVIEKDSRSFVWWTDVDFHRSHFDNWAHSHLGRAMVAYYEATGEPRILDALQKAYREFEPHPVPLYFGDRVCGCTNIDPMLSVYELSGDTAILANIKKIAADSVTLSAVAGWNRGDFDRAHGVITYENIRIPALLYLVTNQKENLDGSLAYMDYLDKNHLLPYDIISSEEHVAGVGSTRNTETCNVGCSEWTYSQLLEVTGESNWGDRIERVFFNAAPAPVSRDFQTMSYYQASNHIEGLLPHDVPGHPGKGAYNFKPTGHDVLCCVGNINRAIPFFIMHQWLGSLDGGLAAALYAPSTVKTIVGNGIPVEIKTVTDYPFEETVRMTVNPAEQCKFPLYLRVPAWTENMVVRINDEKINVASAHGFAKVERKWKVGDKIELTFPMHAEITEGRETPYPQMDYFKRGGSVGRNLANETEVSSPFRVVTYGPLLFALPVKDIDENTQDQSAKWNYALVSDNGNDIEIERHPMPARWAWKIEDAPVRLKVRAAEFDWQPTETLPMPKEYIKTVTAKAEEITLVPYGCTKFRISMFPIGVEE